MHEIITLQLGRQANYTATHFWNAQESYFTYGDDAPSAVDHDIHWRAGLGVDGTETYLPRTVVYDRKGGFGSLRKVNALYDAQAGDDAQGQAQSALDLPAAVANSLWGGRAVVQRAERIVPSAYAQSLDTGVAPAEPLTTSAVRYWSDYNRVYYHPRSMVEVGDEPEMTPATDGAPAAPREYSWQDGEALFADLDREHDLLDRDLRPFAEEADQLQGLQVLASVDDSWGGFAARYLERLRDEYGKTTIWVWALQQPLARLPRTKRITRIANKARTLVDAYAQASLVIPLAVPALPLASVRSSGFDAASAWHTSALLATAIETATLPTRLRSTAGHSNMTSLTDLLNATGKQSVANLQMSVVQPYRDVARDFRARRAAAGFDYDNDDYAGEGGGLGNSDLQLPIDFAPADESAVVASRAGRARPKKPRMFGQAVVTRYGADDDGDDGDEDDRRQGSSHDRRDAMHRRFALKPVSQRYDVPLAFPLLDSFPFIYEATRDTTPAVPVTTALATDRAVADRLQSLRSTVAVGASWAIGLEDREALGNDLATMADAYHDGWSSGSDDDDDE